MYGYPKSFGYPSAYPQGSSAPAVPSNVALTSAGATASADVESLGAGTVSRLFDGSRNPQGDFNNIGGFQQNGTGHWVVVQFASAKTISELDVIFASDAGNVTTDPDLTTPGTTLAALDYTFEYWDGSAWQVVVSVTGNDKQWRQHSITPVNTTKIRYTTITARGGAFYGLEIEAWGV